MEITLSHDAIGAIVRQAISTLQRNCKNCVPFRKKLANITVQDIRDMRERIKDDPETGAHDEPIDVATYFFALFVETTADIQDVIKTLQSGSGNQDDILLLFYLITNHTNCLACLAMIAGGGLLGESQAKEVIIKASRDQAAVKAYKRWEDDPKQIAKLFVKECWDAWQANRQQYKGKAAFARAMLEKREELKSTKVVEDWCRDWEKKKL